MIVYPATDDIGEPPDLLPTGPAKWAKGEGMQSQPPMQLLQQQAMLHYVPMSESGHALVCWQGVATPEQCMPLSAHAYHILSKLCQPCV